MKLSQDRVDKLAAKGITVQPVEPLVLSEEAQRVLRQLRAWQDAQAKLNADYLFTDKPIGH